MGKGFDDFAEDDVVRGLLEGRPQAAEVLYARIHPVIDRTVRRVLRARRPDHDDVVQSAFEHVVRSLTDRRFTASCSLSTWASVIASRVAIDAMRRRMRERSVFREDAASAPEVPWPSDPITLERRLEARSELQRLAALLNAMKPEQSMTVVLHDLLGHQLADIAEATGISAAAAQSRLVRGRKELFRRRAARASMESQPDDW